MMATIVKKFWENIVTELEKKIPTNDSWQKVSMDRGPYQSSEVKTTVFWKRKDYKIICYDRETGNV